MAVYSARKQTKQMSEGNFLRRHDTVGTWGKQGYVLFNPKYRRRRKAVGEDDQMSALSDIDTLEAAKRAGQKYCKGCKKFKGLNQIRFDYELRSGQWYMLWYCDHCGDMIQERLLAR